MMARLADKYKSEVAPALHKQFGYSSPMGIPRLTKVVINMGVGDAIADAKILDQAVEERVEFRFLGGPGRAHRRLRFREIHGLSGLRVQQDDAPVFAHEARAIRAEGQIAGIVSLFKHLGLRAICGVPEADCAVAAG